MRLAQVGGIDRAQRAGTGGHDRAGVGQPRDLAQDFLLALDVRGAEQRPGEHQLPVQRQALALQRHHVQCGRIVDQRDPALRRDQFDDVAHVTVGVRRGEHERRRADAQRGHLRRQRLAVVDDVVRAHLLHPFHRFRARGRGDHGQPGQRPRQLHGDRTDAAGAADHQQGIGRARHRVVHAQAVEQGFPGGQRGQRQRHRVLVIQLLRCMGDDARIHRLQLRVAAGAVDLAGVEHAVARLEALHLAADRAHPAHRVPAQDAGPARFRLRRGAHLHVHRVDRDRLHFDQQVVRAVFRLRHFQVLQRARVGNGQGSGGTDRFHGVLHAFGAERNFAPVAAWRKYLLAGHTVPESAPMAWVRRTRFRGLAGSQA